MKNLITNLDYLIIILKHNKNSSLSFFEAIKNELLEENMEEALKKLLKTSLTEQFSSFNYEERAMYKRVYQRADDIINQ